MGVVILEPHQDDVALFCAFTAMRERAHVITILRDGNGNMVEREQENHAAFLIMGLSHEQWPFVAGEPDWDGVRAALHTRDEDEHPSVVFAPWPEKNGGHSEHDRVGEIAREIFGDRVTFYTTYRVGCPRTVGTPSEPEPWMIPLKLRALACYESQMLRGPRRFFLDALHEWTMP